MVERVKYMITRGGKSLSPCEIEEFLYRYPAVPGVAVVGMPDSKYGVAVWASMQLRDGAAATEDAIRGVCRGQIAHFKASRHAHFAASFPLTVSGKVQKYVIRKLLRSEFRLAGEKLA